MFRRSDWDGSRAGVSLLTAAVLLLTLGAATGAAASRGLLCMCSTADCQEAGVDTCTTTGLCYTEQRRGAGAAEPATRGCVRRGKTSLLCDRQLPIMGTSMHCCEAPLCNKLVAPTWRPQDSGRRAPAQPPHHRRRHKQFDDAANRTLEALLSLGSRQPAPWRPGPLVISVLAVGVILVMGISALGLYILRSQRFAMDVPFSACPHDHGTP
ncbi:uncharacterized protein LOC119096774 [Pollicipes pollicipes]|uniref:uncharacterized protein LOC119096774 n=1 Tax=Pollicipes pollicipes TaxID=41117 RepID=UPI001884E479|nr:uncharacterized protein LOC119096774 [Pollicipes pollicipes]